MLIGIFETLFQNTSEFLMSTRIYLTDPNAWINEFNTSFDLCITFSTYNISCKIKNKHHLHTHFIDGKAVNLDLCMVKLHHSG